MADAIRFFLDENVHGEAVAGLRACGIDAISAREVGRLRLPNPEQLAFATAEGRVLVTHDQDYLALHATGTSHADIAGCHPTSYSLGQLIGAPVLVCGAMTADEMIDHVEYL